MLLSGLSASQLSACDGSGYVFNSITNNGDGTYTLDMTIYIAGADHAGGILGGTQGFFLTINAPGGIISVTPLSLTSLNGTTLNGTIAGGTVTWGTPGAGPFFVDASEPTQTFDITIVVSGLPTAWNGGGMEGNNCPGGAGTSTPSPGYSGTICLPPDIDVSALPDLICEGVPFSVQATANISPITWSNGQQGPAIVYVPTNSTTLTASVENECGSAQQTLFIDVVPQPTLEPIPPIFLCEGEKVNLEVNAENADVIQWSNGEEGTPLIFTPEASETLILTVSNACNTLSLPVIIDVALDNIELEVLEGDQGICDGESADIEVFVQNAANFVWSNGWPLPSQTVSPNWTTTYAAVAWNRCFGDTVFVEIEVFPQPSLESITPDQTLCRGDSLTLEAIAGSDDAFVFWDNGQLGDQIIVFPDQTTTYTATVSNFCGELDSSLTITVLDQPSLTVLQGDQEICIGESATFSVSAPNDHSLQWSNGSTASSITVSPQQSESYTITATNECGPLDTTLLLTVNEPPSFSVLEGSQTICDGDTATLAISPVGADIIEWSNGSSDTSIAVSPSGMETYTLTLENGCGQVDSSFTVGVTPLPSVQLVQGSQAICLGETANLAVQIANADSLIWNTGSTTQSIIVSPQQDSTFTAVASSGCGLDSVSATVTVNPVYSIDINLEACPGSSVAYAGTSVLAGTSQTFNFSTVEGCDSIVQLNVIELPTFASELNLSTCAGTTVDYNGTALSPGDTQPFTLSAVNGCDSVVTVTVSALPTFASELNLSTCPGTMVDYNGTTLSPGDTLPFTFSAVNGCDSVVTVTVAALPTFASELNLSTCPGTTVDYNGTALSPGDSQPFTLSAANGCDSVVTVSVAALPTFASELSLSTCPGTTIDYNGTSLSPGDTQAFTLPALNGCDSVVTVSVAAFPSYEQTLELQACTGFTVNYNGQPLQPGSVQDFTFSTVNGCDSVVTVSVEEVEILTSSLALEACPGSTVDYNGNALLAGTVQDFAYTAQTGCDSIVTVSVTELPTFASSLALEACTGSTVSYQGVALSPGDSQAFTLSAANGCDSVVTVTVAELEVFNSDLSLEACANSTAEYAGQVLDPGDSQAFVLSAQNGCDSTVQVTVLELPIFEQDLTLEICQSDSIAYGGTILLPGDQQSFILVAENGCDSTVNLSVLGIPPVETELSLSACSGESASYNGELVPAGSAQAFTFSSQVGCDSIVNVQVVELEVYDHPLSLQACAGTTLMYAGTELSPGDSLPFVFMAANGCDSTINVLVEELAVYDQTLNLQACTGFTVDYNGMALEPGSVQTFTFSTQAGCDSVVTVQVEEVEVLEESLSFEACPGSSITYNGNTLLAGEVQDFTFSSQTGCDSIVTVSVIELPTFESSLSLEACAGSSVSYEGVALFAGDSQAFTLMAANGCDSVVQVSVAELEVFSDSLELAACPGSSVAYAGQNLLPGDSQAFVLTAQNGCDSNVQVSVLELPTFEQDLMLQSCLGATITYNGTTLGPDDEQSFVLMAQNGCDSVVNVSVVGVDVFESDLELSACSGTSVTYDGVSLTAGSSQDFTFISQIGCDSIVSVQVLELPTYEQPLTLEACQGATLTYQGTVFAPGDEQTFVLSTQAGCDSIIHLSVVGVDTLATFEPRSICEGDSSLIFGQAQYTSGLYLQTNISSNGCDSTHRIQLDVRPLPSIQYSSVDACPDEANGTASLMASGSTGPYAFTWPDGSTAAERSNLAMGSYIITATDGTGCAQTTIVQVLERSLEPGIEARDISCFGFDDGVIAIQASGQGLRFSLDGQNFGPSGFFTRLEPGPYTAYVEDAIGCIYELPTIILEEPDELAVQLPPDTTIRWGDSLLVQAQVNRASPVRFTWRPDYELSCTDCNPVTVSPKESLYYYLTVQDDNGCRADDRILVYVDKSRDVYIPNIFSPNGDGANDRFYIFTGPGVVKIKTFRVYSRWGEPVFENYNFQPNNPIEGWDGTYRGELMNGAVFAYYAEIEFQDGEVVLYEGDVLLFR